MARHARINMGMIRGRIVQPVEWSSITELSVVHVAVSERRPGSMDLTADDRFVGAADLTVTNVAPRRGGLDFAVNVNWGSPINILADITVFDGPEAFNQEKIDRSGP